MALSPAALLDLLRRDKVKDPFGGDDLFDGESRMAGKGPKIALAASGVLFLVLVGFVGYVFMTGDKNAAAPLAAGSLADLTEEEDTTSTALPPTATPPVAAKQAVAADATAATDRSASRRPWLAPSTPVEGEKRLGVAESTPSKAVETKPEIKVATAPEAKETPPAAKSPAELPKTTAAEPPMPKMAEPPKPTMAEPPKALPAETKAAAAVKEMPATPAAKMSSEKAPATPEPVKIAAEEDSGASKDVGGIPALTAAGVAPGAPKRFDQLTGADAGPAAAGGRPRLAEPPIPPTDRIAVSAPPPRFAALADTKRDTKAAPPTAGNAKLAVVVDGLGLSQSATEAAIAKLPAAVTLAFSPYARDLKKWMEKAKASGHEVLIEVPMESKDFPAEDPGPLGLLTINDAKENQDRLETILKEAGTAVGVLDSGGSKFREDQAINGVFAKLKERNLFYVQGRPGVRVGEATVPTAVADVVADERPFRAAVDARLDYAERLAKYQGSAVASMSAKPVSFERLVLWVEQSQKKGVTLTPISQVLIR